jgi:hypothetical protein
MSLDVYSRAIVPDEVDPEALKATLLRGSTAPGSRRRDAPVMHGKTPKDGKTPHLRGFPVAGL